MIFLLISISFSSVEVNAAQKPSLENDDVFVNPTTNKVAKPAYGGGTWQQAFKINFGQSYLESYWTYTDNWYKVSTTERGTLKFGIKPNTGDDLDIYVYDNTGNKLLCSSTGSGSAEDFCTLEKGVDYTWDFYINIRPFKIPAPPAIGSLYTKKICTARSTGNKRCGSGNVVEEEYQNVDCSITWNSGTDCDNQDDDGEYDSPVCSLDRIVKKKVSYDYSCSGAGSCTYTTTSSSLLVKSCTYGCQEGNSDCYECTTDSHCGTGKKCSSNKCVAKTCSELGNSNGACDTNSNKKRNNDVIYECKDQLPSESLDVYCWQQIATKGSNDFCSYAEDANSPCQKNDWDCDGITSQGNCDTGLVCKGPCVGSLCDVEGDLTSYDGCCLTNEQWDTSAQVCRQCLTSNDCSSGYKCSNYQCEQKTCSDFISEGADASCASGKNENEYYREENLIFQCQSFQGIKCRVLKSNKGQNDFCSYPGVTCGYNDWDCDGSGQGNCNSGLVCLGINGDDNINQFDGCCLANELWDSTNHVCYSPCKLNSISWEKNNVEEGENVDVLVNWQNCKNTDKVDLVIKERDDCLGKIAADLTDNSSNLTGNAKPAFCGDEVVATASEYLNENPKKVNWKSIFQTLDLNPSNTYYVEGVTNFNGYTSEAKSGELTTTKACADNDNDGYKSNQCGGNDCDDGNPLINPGRSEICDNIDNNCNEDIDEIFNKNIDSNNCGSCGVKCSTGYRCELGSCKKLPVCGNGICETGETSTSCVNDCYTAACTIPDGSSITCSCSSNSDCTKYGNYYCKDNGRYDKCERRTYADECSNHDTYYCENADVKKCEYNSARENYEINQVKSCTGAYEYCDVNTVNYAGECSKYANKLNAWLDYSDSKVNKQVDDIVKVNIYSEQNAVVNVNYDSNYFVGDCSSSFNVRTGVNTCTLTVKEGSFGEKNIKVNEKVLTVNLVENPKLLIVTDSKKLTERFANELEGVKAVLKQAYANAAKDNGVVYDLSAYNVGENPFNSFSNYDENVFGSLIKNDYSLLVANFVKEKCVNCESVMIVGDDYVVPYYRRNIPVYETRLFSDRQYDTQMYTDMSMIKKRILPFSDYFEMFKQDNKYEGKDVLLILPHDISNEQRIQVNNLKSNLTSKYKPDFTEMDGKDIYCYDERWFAKTSGKTLIIIGTEENNNAFRCMPFVAGDLNRDSAFMQPNVWDNEEYALVINTEEPKVIETLSLLIEGDDLVKLKGESAYFFHVGTQYAGYAAMGIGLITLTVGTGGTGAVALIAAAAVMDAAADSTDAVDTCVVNNEGVGWCGASVAFAIVPFVSGAPAKKAIKEGIDIFDSLSPSTKNFIEDTFSKLNKHFDKKVLRRFDPEHVAKGTDEIIKQSGKNADEAISDFKKTFGNSERGQEHAIRTLVKYGKYSDEFFEQNHFVRYTEIDKRIFRVDNRVPKNVINGGGFQARGTSLNYEKYATENEGGRFIGASQTPEGGVIAAISTGNIKPEGLSGSWVYVIDPRGKNFLDDIGTLPNPGPNRIAEQGVIAIDEVHPDDIVGAVYVRVESKIEGNTINILSSEITDIKYINSNYKGKFNMNSLNFQRGDL